MNLKNMKNLNIYSTYFIVFALFSCSNSKTSTLKKDAKSKDFEMVAYNNPELSTDLGVGLWAWPLPMDYDNDGDMDLIVSCPDTPFNGTYFFENTSNGTTKMPIFEAPKKIGQGMKNLQVFSTAKNTRVLGRGIEYLNFKDSIFSNPKKLFPNDQLEKGHQKLRFSQWTYVDYENDGDLDLLVGIDDWSDYGWDNAFDSNGKWTNGPLHGHVYLLENINGKYVEKGKIEADGKPIDVYGAPSPNMYDFDGDADLDLICGEFLDRLTWFENTGTREKPFFAKGRFLTNQEGIIKMDLEMIIPSAVDWDKDGDMDLIVGDEDGRVAFIENTGVEQNNMPVFKSPKYFQQKSQHVKFGALATPNSVDWDDDGDEDLIVGNSAGYIGFIENLGGLSNPQWANPMRLRNTLGNEIRYLAGDSGSIQGPAEKKWGYTTLSVSDWDGDGLKDIIVNSIWGKIEWHKNIGKKGNPELLPAQPVAVDWQSSDIPKPEWNWWSPSKTELATQWRTTPYTIDWNQDGLMDLVMLDHEGFLALYERYRTRENGLMLKPGQRIFWGLDVSEYDNKNNPLNTASGPLRLNSGKYGKSGRRKLTFVDWDQDGDLDLIVNSKNAAWFENLGTEKGKVLMKFKGDLSEQKLAGHTTSPTIVDWDKNGVPDLLLGAEDGFLYHLKNTLK
ncbi:FG-GAP repeat domain-containing protein [Arenibacter aquaticus]|nr:VCBS repeat-containing protein [Arenibacter aquaticus]